MIGDTVGDPFQDTAGPGDQPAAEGDGTCVALADCSGGLYRSRLDGNKLPSAESDLAGALAIVVIAVVIKAKRRPIAVQAEAEGSTDRPDLRSPLAPPLA